MRRLALCVGISRYTSLGSLNHARADAELIADRLRQRSFHCIEVHDASGEDLDSALENFQSQVSAIPATEVKDCFIVVFFAGHGVEVAGGGYLLPSGFPEQVTPSALRHYAISVERLLEAIASYQGPKVLVLDACRSNVEVTTAHDRSVLSELMEEQQKLYQGAANSHNVLIAYSTSAGDSASDGFGGNSTFSRCLAAEILRYDLSVQEVFTRVGQQVISSTGARQRPWYYSSLTESVSFLDLPELTQGSVSAMMHAPSARSRLLPHGNSLIYYAGCRVYAIAGVESRLIISTQDELEAVASIGQTILVATNGVLLEAGADEALELGKHGVRDPFGIIVAPSFQSFVVIGINSFSIFQRIGEAWRCVIPAKPGHGCYGGAYLNEERLVLSTDCGELIIVDIPEANITSIKLPIRQPCYAVKVLTHTREIISASTGGRLDYFDQDTLAWKGMTELNQVRPNSPHAYSVLRDSGLSPADAYEFLINPERYAVRCSENSEELFEYVRSLLPQRNPICMEVTDDPRLLIVAFDDGFIFSVDVRSRELVRILDCGGSRGEGVNWLASDSSGRSVALSDHGTITHFDAIPPRF